MNQNNYPTENQNRDSHSKKERNNMKQTMITIGILHWAITLLLADSGAVKNQFDVTPYGFIKFETFYDNTEVAKGDWLLYVPSGNNANSNNAVFSMNARHTRIGLKISGPELNNAGKISGLIEADFAGGFPNSSTAARQPNIRLRHAWVEVNYPKWQARFGQDWALIAGPFPNTTSFVVGAGKGNLWMRYPQARFTFNKNPFTFAISINRPIAGNVKYDDYAGGDFDPVGDGERSGIPWIMGRLWYNPESATISISGHIGQENIDNLSGNSHTLDTYSLNGDLTFSLGSVSATLRIFTGENLNSFFGGVFQGFTRDSVSVSNVSSYGGWGQVTYKVSDPIAITIGGGMDDPDDEILTSSNRSKNTWAFANIAYKIHTSLIFMLETEYLKTDYIGQDSGENIRIQFVTYYKF